MNPAVAWITAHKPQAALGAAGLAAAGLGLRAKKKGGGPADAAAGGTQSYAPSGSIPYDSAGFDTYNALEGMIENLAGQLAELRSAHPLAPAKKKAPPHKKKKKKRQTLPLPKRPHPVTRKKRRHDAPQPHPRHPRVVYQPHPPVARRRPGPFGATTPRQGTANSPTGRIF